MINPLKFRDRSLLDPQPITADIPHEPKAKIKQSAGSGRLKSGDTSGKPAPVLQSPSATIIGRAPFPIVEVHGLSHIVSYGNPAFCLLVGKTNEELIGSSFAEILSGWDKCMPVLDQVFKIGKPLIHAQEDGPDPASPSWQFSMWPALDGNELIVGVIIQVAKSTNARLDTVAVNEALLIAGLQQHERMEETENLNVQLQSEIIDHRNTEKKLLASELEAKRALDYAEDTLRTTPVPFLVLRADLRVNTASEAFYTDFKVKPAVTEGRLIYEIGNGQWNIPKLRELLEDIIPMRNVFDGFQVTHEFADIGTRTMLLNARRVDNADGVPDRILLAIEDVTEHVRAEEVKALLGAIVSSADDGILSKTLEGVVTSWNASAERLFGYTAEEIIGNSIVHLTPPDLFHEEEHLLAQVLAGKAVEHFETQRMTKDGSRLQVSLTISPIKDATGKVIGASKIVRDITDRKKAETALQASELRIATLLEHLPVGVGLFDSDGQIVLTNAIMRRFIGESVPSLDLERRHRWRTSAPDGSQLEFSQWPGQRALRGEKVLPGVEFCFTEDDGRETWVTIAAIPLRDSSGAVVMVEDIDQRKQAEDALRVAMLEIESASRAKDDFLATLSHELRTPLTPVLMTATALETDPSLSEEVQGQLSMMRRNIELEARLIDDLLDMTTISRGKLNLAQVITDLHSLLGHTDEIVRSDGLGKQVQISLNLRAKQHYALVDPTRIQQVFWNLIKNAIKFTPGGGSIIVNTSNDAEGRIVISVKDSGEGISAEALPNIFNAFEQGDVTGQHRCGGLGLGLAISKAITTAHGGTISGESAGPGLGATFTITLSSAVAPMGTGTGTEIETETAPVTLRLLIVEDHDTTRMVLAQLLTRRGHKVTTAGNIQEALAAYRAEIFDVVISDLGLPDGNGMDMMRKIQSIRPVPAIALTGYGMEEDLIRTKEAGFSAHLVKPVNVDKLRQIIDQITLAAG